MIMLVLVHTVPGVILLFFFDDRILNMVHAAYLNAMLAAFFTFSIRLFQRYKQANVSFGVGGV